MRGYLDKGKIGHKKVIKKENGRLKFMNYTLSSENYKNIPRHNHNLLRMLRLTVISA